MSRVKFDKPALTVEQMLQQFEGRGLVINDRSKAETILQFISYYRFVGYGLIFEKFDGNKKRLDLYEPETTFEDILYRYDFDRHLRLLINDAIERIEVAIRTLITHQLSIKYNPHWYLDREVFKSSYGHGSLISIVERDTGFSRQGRGKRGEVFIRHYYVKYDKPSLPASWMAAEVLSLGTWSGIYQNLAKLRDQKNIALEFSLSVDELESWLHAITYLRNLCAHHSRIFNKTFTITPKVSSKLPNIPNNRFGYFAGILFYLLEKIAPNQHWHLKLKELIEKHPEISLKELGLPENWRESPFWGFPTEDKK